MHTHIYKYVYILILPSTRASLPPIYTFSIQMLDSLTSQLRLNGIIDLKNVSD